MAIDTAEKRRSASGVPFLPLGPGVTPNAAADLEWRQQAGWGYSGILVTEPVAEPPPASTPQSGRTPFFIPRRKKLRLPEPIQPPIFKGFGEVVFDGFSLRGVGSFHPPVFVGRGDGAVGTRLQGKGFTRYVFSDADLILHDDLFFGLQPDH